MHYTKKAAWLTGMRQYANNGTMIFLLQETEHSQFVGKDKHNTERSKIADDETINGIKGATDCAVVGHFCPQHFLVNHPAKKYAHQHSTYWHNEFGNKKIEEIKES
jgi:hypothetical protein